MARCSLSEFADAYIEAALLLMCDDEGDQSDKSIYDLAPETLAEMRADCRRFYVENETAIHCDDGPGNQARMAGYDFWLTRCGHGAGFWDGDWPEPHATQLTNASEEFGNVELYVGDDGKVWS